MDLRTVKVFIASSNELSAEREKFDTLFNHLNNIFTARGVRLEPVKWEFLDASMGREHKQEEYNREIKNCDICVVMFWQRFGEFTETELEVANAELQAGRKPAKIFVFFKEVGEVSEELKQFKESFDKKYGHFYSKFDCVDKLQLDFILQLERFLHSNIVKVENSQVKLDNVVVAHLDNIGFASSNDKYKSLREDIDKLNKEIADFEIVCKTMSNPTIEAMLNDKKRERYEKQNELSQHEELLLGAAVRVAKFAGERVSERMQRAMALFEQGKVSEANAVLDEAERDADKILNSVKELKTVGAQSIGELITKANYVLADNIYPINERIAKTESLYDKAVLLAQEIGYEKEEYNKLLSSYGEFLLKYAKYSKAEEIFKQTINLREEMYGVNDAYTADAYNSLGRIYDNCYKLDLAWEYFNKALEIREATLGCEHPETAKSYNNLGGLYFSLKDDADKALEYHFKSLKIKEKVLGIEHLSTANSYHNIGVIYDCKEDYDKALEFHYKALEIREKELGNEHPDTAHSYSCIGDICYYKNDYDKSIELHHKALKIREKVLGNEHPDTAASYNSIGGIYWIKGEYEKALEYCFKTLDIYENVFGLKHTDTAITYANIGEVYQKMGDYDHVLEYANKALNILNTRFNESHSEVVRCKEMIEEAQNKQKKKE